jgi:hypothetical protein
MMTTRYVDRTIPLGVQHWRGAAALRRAEEELVRTLREIPEGPLKRELIEVMQELADLVRSPSCPEAQADGVPCATAATACEDCQHVVEILASLRLALGWTLDEQHGGGLEDA